MSGKIATFVYCVFLYINKINLCRLVYTMDATSVSNAIINLNAVLLQNTAVFLKNATTVILRAHLCLVMSA